MSEVVDFDGGTNMPIRGFYAGMKWVDIVLSFFENDETTPLPVVDKDYKFVVSKDNNETDIRLTTDVVVADNTMTVSVSQAANILKAGQYYYRIYSDQEAFPLFYGLLSINHKKAQFV